MRIAFVVMAIIAIWRSHVEFSAFNFRRFLLFYFVHSLIEFFNLKIFML